MTDLLIGSGFERENLFVVVRSLVVFQEWKRL